MATEAERFLRKARESLASAEADIEGGRHNSAANRAYYAAFQAAIAALSHEGIRPTRDWDHRFVSSQFSGKLIWRRKIFPGELSNSLANLFEVRIVADYRREDILARRSEAAVREASKFVQAVAKFIESSVLREPRVEYGGEMTTRVSGRKKGLAYVDEIKSLVTSRFPSAEFEVIEFGPRDFRLIVWVDGDDETMEVSDVISDRRTEILVKTGVWVVVLVLDRTQRDN